MSCPKAPRHVYGCFAAGVIGNTPLLRPYDCFEYYSSTYSHTKEGSMGGSFQMLGIHPESRQHFDALIQPFRLIGR